MRCWRLLLVGFLSIFLVFHSGRTDKNGGHTDHSTGEYHYHHGEPAHTHSPNNEPDDWCPYRDGGEPTRKKRSASTPMPQSTPVATKKTIRTEKPVTKSTYKTPEPTAPPSESTSFSAKVKNITDSTPFQIIVAIAATLFVNVGLPYILYNRHQKKKLERAKNNLPTWL